MVNRCTVEDMNTTQTLNRPSTIDYDKARVQHDLAALRGTKTVAPQSFPARVIAAFKTVWRQQENAQQALIERETPWLDRR